MVFPVWGKLLQLGELKFPYVNSTQNTHTYVYAHTHYIFIYMYICMFLAGAGKTNHAVPGCQRVLHRGWCTHFAVHLNSKAETSNRMYYDSITSQPSGLESQDIFFYLLFIMLPYFIRYTVFLATHLRFDCIFICHRDTHHWNSKWKNECMHPFSSYAVFHVNRDAMFTSIS